MKIEQELQEYKSVIRGLLKIYTVDVDDEGRPTASIAEIMELIGWATELITELKREEK